MSEVTAALAKSKVAWLLLPADVTVPCWYAASGSTAYLVGGDGEQSLPALPESLRIILRDKATRQAVGPVPARATRIDPGSADWETATSALLAARQNNPPEGLREHWASQCVVWSLDVDSEVSPEQEPAAGQPTDAPAGTPGETPADIPDTTAGDGHADPEHRIPGPPG